ncbi:MAG: hypothetical protein LLG14_05880 [Nocardiaceae bacterium]|nr:hypothetical protein [Nocardiaceae bacterium]
MIPVDEEAAAPVPEPIPVMMPEPVAVTSFPAAVAPVAVAAPLTVVVGTAEEIAPAARIKEAAIAGTTRTRPAKGAAVGDFVSDPTFQRVIDNARTPDAGAFVALSPCKQTFSLDNHIDTGSR